MPRLSDALNPNVAAHVLAAIYPDGLRVDQYEHALSSLVALAELAPKLAALDVEGEPSRGSLKVAATASRTVALAPTTPFPTHLPEGWQRSGKKKGPAGSLFINKFTEDERLSVLNHLTQVWGPMSAPELSKHVQAGPDALHRWLSTATKEGRLTVVGRKRKRYHLAGVPCERHQT